MGITTYKGQPYTIDVNQLANNGSDGNWLISNKATHNNNLGSYITRDIPELIENDTYRVTYTVTDYTNCSTRVYLGNTAGTIRNGAGTYTEVLTHTGGNNAIRFWSNGNNAISYYKVEHLETNIIENEISIVENKSWTLSYNPILKQWISFHSYLPNNYLPHPNKFLAKRNNTDIKLGNNGDFGKFFDEDIKPFIIETVFNDSPLETKVFDSIHANINTTINDVSTNKFFDEVIIYDEYQCTGTIILDGSNLTKKERNWSFNKFADITNNLQQSIFVKDWNNTKIKYPIDKVLNITKLDNNKPWFTRGRMRDKYIAVRFIENNLENNLFYCTFVLSYFRASQR